MRRLWPWAPAEAHDCPLRSAVSLAAVLESLVGWNNLGDQVTYVPIQSNGVLNQVGKDFFAYMFVRDPGARNIP